VWAAQQAYEDARTVHEQASLLVVIKSEGHDQPHNWLRLNPVAVLTVAEARARWWITDAAGANLVSGGAADHDRMVRLRDEKYAGCQVQRGDEFIAEGAGHVLAL
jgi:hypothetical protein